MADTKMRIDIEASAKVQKATSDVEKLNQALGKTEQAGAKAATGGKNMGQAMLQGSRAIQDLQYGIGGVLNNIEGLASAFGMGAGVAGAATVAAVALSQLAPHLGKLIEAIIPLDDVLGKVSEKLAQDAVEAGQAYMTTVDNAGKQSRAFEAALQGEKIALDALNGSIERQVKLLETRSRIQLLLEDAALAAQVEDIKAQKLSPAEEARQIAQAKLGSQARKAGIEETGRQTAMQAAQGQFGNLAMAAAAAQQRSEGEQAKAEAEARFNLNQREIAKAQDELRAALAEFARIEAEFGTNAAKAVAGAEVSRLQGGISTRERDNAAILARYGGQVPKGLTPEQLTALRADAEAKRGGMLAAGESVAGLSTQQQAAREMSAAQLALQQQAIARDYTAAANPGAPLFNNPLTALGFMQRTGQAALTPQAPGGPLASPLGQFFGTPLEGGFSGGLGAPLGAITAPISEAAQTLQGSPLDLSELGRPLEQLGTAVTGMRDQLQQQVQQLGTKVEQINQQLRNAR